MGRALELTLSGRPVDAEEAHRIGLVNEVVPPAASTCERALELAERLAGFPQETMLAGPARDARGRAAAVEEALDLEHASGREVMEVAARGAGRFACGEGRHGAGV